VSQGTVAGFYFFSTTAYFKVWFIRQGNILPLTSNPGGNMMLGLHSNASQESEHSQNSLFSSDVPNSMELFSQPNSSQSQSQTTAGIPHLHSQDT